jgi:chemotaxis protein MotB
MTNALTALRQRMEDLRALLAEKEAQAARDKVAIASLGKSLNNALASRVQELKNFRSEFFGRLREYLSGRDDVQIVGDRFVFQSEVLFAAGQADIGPAGEEQLAKLALALGEIADSIPADIQWILQVDGHTDNVPIRAGRYADNWDLSTERALSVVRFLARNGVPATRLAATGYGEFQPLDTGDSDDARRRNRRIELKITQRVTAKQQ